MFISQACGKPGEGCGKLLKSSQYLKLSTPYRPAQFLQIPSRDYVSDKNVGR